jgi:trehalose-phosphatase
MPELESQISKVATRINSKYSTLTHQPLVLLSQDISYSQFLALMSVAEIFMVTSLREGMNLTSHDYIHCQDGKVTPQFHGTLILSEFTGSASIFHGHEFLVNPWDYREVADAINKALEISPEQKQRNWEFLLERKAPHTAVAWCNSFKTALAEAHSAQLSRELSLVATLPGDALKESYEKATKRLFFLEDEGTITSANPAFTATPSLLEALLRDSKNLVYVTSNKSSEQIECQFASFSDKIGFIAENGCFKREIGTTEWKPLVDMERAKDWRNGIRRVMQYYQERTDGSVLEERRCLLTFWYNNAQDPEIAARQASDLADMINGSRGSEAIRVVLTDGSVSVEPLDITKAKAAESILEQLSQTPDFLFVAGGSRGDEALFRWANRLHGEDKIPSVTTVTVGSHATEATSVLPTGMSIADVVNIMTSSSVNGANGANGHEPPVNGDNSPPSS